MCRYTILHARKKYICMSVALYNVQYISGIFLLLLLYFFSWLVLQRLFFSGQSSWSKACFIAPPSAYFTPITSISVPHRMWKAEKSVCVFVRVLYIPHIHKTYHIILYTAYYTC